VQAELQNSFLKKMIFNMGMRAKETEIKKSIVRMNSIWDKIVFKKIQESMGGRLRLMLVGSAPLAANVLTFTRCALGCVVVEGYGQTECTAPITLTIQVRVSVINRLCSRFFTSLVVNIPRSISRSFQVDWTRDIVTRVFGPLYPALLLSYVSVLFQVTS